MNQHDQITTTAQASRDGLRRRFVAMTLAAISIFGCVMAFQAAPASAVSLPAGYAPNGCTLSPDRGWVPTYYDFKNACNRHDYCYDEMWYGGGDAGRRSCDDNFFREMNGWCAAYYSPWWAAVNRSQCYGVAGTYNTAVRLLGAPYFNNPYKN